jgi:hypothetical protein
MGKLPKLKNPLLPPKTPLRVAKPPAPAPDALKALPEELWALERADLMRRAAEAEKTAALLERALTLQVIDPKGKIRTLETLAAASDKLLAEAKVTHEAAIERIRARLGVTGAFDIDSDSGVIFTGSSPEQKE